jgi:hypothetical protein
MAAQREPVWPQTESVTVKDGSVVWTMSSAPSLPSISAVVYTFNPSGISQSSPTTSGTRTRVKFDSSAVELGTYSLLAEITAGGEDYSLLTTIEVID